MICLVENTKAIKSLVNRIDQGIPAIVGDLTTVDIFENFRKLNATADGSLG